MEEMGENKTQVIIHKSNWASQMLYMVLGMIVIFSFYMKNPTEKDFMKALVKKVSVESGNSNGLSESISKIVSDLGNDIITLPVERNDYLFFSTYSLTTDQIHVTGFGIIGKVYIVSFELDTKGFYKYKNIDGWNELPKDAKDFFVTQMEMPGTNITLNDIQSFKMNNNQDKIDIFLSPNESNTQDVILHMIKLPTGWKFEIIKNNDTGVAFERLKWEEIEGWNEIPEDAKRFCISQMSVPGTDMTVSDIQSFKINDNQDKIEVTLTQDGGIIRMTKLPTGWKFN